MLNHVQLFAMPWTVARQAPLSMGFSRQEYQSGLPFPSPGDLPNPGIKPTSSTSPVLPTDSLPLHHVGSPSYVFLPQLKFFFIKKYFLKIQISNKDLLYSTGDYIPFLIITYNRKSYIHIYTQCFGVYPALGTKGLQEIHPPGQELGVFTRDQGTSFPHAHPFLSLPSPSPNTFVTQRSSLWEPNLHFSISFSKAKLVCTDRMGTMKGVCKSRK